VTLLEQLGADTRALLPNQKSEAWKYTSLRALDAASKTLTVAALCTDLSALEPLAATPLVPLAQAYEANKVGRDVVTPRPSIFAELAAQSAKFSTLLTGTNYFVLAPDQTRALVQQQHVFQLPAAQKSTLIWHHGGAFEGSFANYLTQISVPENAELTLIRVQNCAATASILERSEITLAKGASFKVIDVNFGAQWARHELQITLAGENASAELILLSTLSGRQHIDTQLELRHEVANTRSVTRFKSVANQRARAVFNGRIFVAVGADGTDAQLKTNNLLLSDAAEIDVKPELEIHAEEVSCSHGATVGQLDENALFYLRARGIAPEQARQMLTLAFCQELLDRVDDSALREKLSALLLARLPSELSV
jgi:Fe-S cluster assembly protein SufD